MPQYALMASTLLQLIRNAAYITLIKTNIGDNLNVIAQNASYVKAVGNPVLNYLSITNSGLPAVVETKNNGNDFHLELNNITLASLALSEVSVLSAPALKRIGTFCLPDTFPISYFDPCWSIGTVFRNNSFSSLSLPSLDSIKTTVFYLLDNQYLSNLSLPVLQDVNGFNISSNPELRVVDLPKLDAIDWEFNVTGNLDRSVYCIASGTNRTDPHIASHSHLWSIRTRMYSSPRTGHSTVILSRKHKYTMTSSEDNSLARTLQTIRAQYRPRAILKAVLFQEE